MSELSQRTLYVDCIQKQLEEIDMLCSIYSAAGEMHINDASVISDFNEFIAENADVALKSHLDFSIKLNVLNANGKQEKLDVRFELPHLYPALENAIVSIHTNILSKCKQQFLKTEIEKYIETLEKSETYVFQILSWLQDQLELLIRRDNSEFESSEPVDSLAEQPKLIFERLWIYSHHIKSSAKRQAIVQQSRSLDLSGFSRPGKPGVICVEGLQQNTQEFWKLIKAMNWQKIFICKNETSKLNQLDLSKKRRFQGFKEQLYCDDLENEEGVMSMGLFIKYLEAHQSGYMKKELFGLN